MRALEPRPGRRSYGLRALVGLPVRIGEVDVGRVSEVLLDRSLGHCLGFVLDSRGANRRFLPWVAARVERDHVAALSAFALLSTSELAFYLDRGLPLSGELSGDIDDVEVDREGDVVTVVARSGRGGSMRRAS